MMTMFLLQKVKGRGKARKSPCGPPPGKGGGEQTDIPALRKHNAKEKANEQNAGTNPSVGRVGSDFVEIALV